MSAALRVVFAGTPEFALPCLEALCSIHKPVAVFSQPDRPAGRGRKLMASPVKALAQKHAITVFTPLTLRDPDTQQQLSELRPDLLIVVAYGLILPKKVLAIPRLGCWNVHASLLPRWRGAAPIQRALEAGDQETGVCLMRMEAGLDTGPVYLTSRTPISATATAQSLHDELAVLGAALLRVGLGQLADGSLPKAQAQSEIGVCYANKLEKTQARLDLAEPAELLARRVRAFQPYPVAELELIGERVQLLEAQALTGSSAPPGSVVAASKSGIDLACGTGVLRVTQLRRAGGKRISAADYLNARPELRR